MSTVLSYFVYYFIEALVMYYYCSHIFAKKHKELPRKKIISAYFFTYMTQYLLSFFYNTFINIFSFFILNFILILFNTLIKRKSWSLYFMIVH